MRWVTWQAPPGRHYLLPVLIHEPGPELLRELIRVPPPRRRVIRPLAGAYTRPLLSST